MTAQIDTGSHVRRLAMRSLPFFIVALAGVAVRTPLAAGYPFAALLLFLWITADTLMLALFARSSRTPAPHAVLAVLAAAAMTVSIGSPPIIREALLDTPVLAGVLAMVVLVHLAWAMARARRIWIASERLPGSRWVNAASEILPPALVRLAAVEVTIIHMALFRWGGPADVPGDARAFAYHRHLTPMCVTLLILSAIEIAVYHLLLGHWSRTGAVVMFILSDLGFVYLVGLIKSFRFRPVLLTADGIRVRAGLLIDQFVPIDAIAAVDGDVTGDEVRDPATFNAALLAWPNIVVRLKHPVHRRSILKGERPFDRIAFRLDEPDPFVRLLSWRADLRRGDRSCP